MKNDFKTIIIFDDPSCMNMVRRFASVSGSVVIPFSVESKIECEKRGIKSYFQDELMDLPDINKIGADNMNRVKNIAAFLDSRLQDGVDDLKKNNLRILSSSYHFLKILFDTIYTSYCILEKLLDEFDVKDVIVMIAEGADDNLVEGRGSMIGALMENVLLNKKRNIRIVRIKKYTCPEKIISYLRYVKRYVVRYRAVAKRKSHAGNGLILHNGHDIPYLTGSVLGDINFYMPYFVNDSLILCSDDGAIIKIKKSVQKSIDTAYIDKLFDDSNDDLEYQKMFPYDENLFQFTNALLKQYVRKTLGRLLPLIDDMKSWISCFTPKLIVTSDCRFNLETAFLFEIARSSKIPVITYQEGGCAGFLDCPMIDVDTRLSDKFLVYGQGVKDSPFVRGGSNVVPVGSIRLNAIRQKLTEKRGKEPTIFFVPDILQTGTYQHYPCNCFFSRAYARQLKIINILKEFSDIKFIIKTVKEREFLYSRFADRSMEIKTRPLENILGECSAFILDYPFTAIHECLLTCKPIALLYDARAFGFDPAALALLKKRVRVSSDTDEYRRIVKLLIEDVRSGCGMTADNEFSRNYSVKENAEANLRRFFDDMLLKE